MTHGRAALLAAAVAALIYLPALANRFALDDGPIVERNPAAHSIDAALHAFDRSYWPPQDGAGQWRPLVVLSFALGWQLSGGSPTWLHAGNVLWHAAATGLLVLVLAPYVTTAGALAGGILFALHPVHVEAVANLVGRAEPMTACFLFLALLLGRGVRERRAAGRRSWLHETGLALAVVAALLTKEHAALAVALLALDDVALRPRLSRPLPWRDYAAVGALTLAWFLVRRPIDAGHSFAMIAPTFYGLGLWGRLCTMLPVVFVLVRLLVWPFALSPDYGPQVVPRLAHFSLEAAGGLLFLLALGTLAAVAWRRQRALGAGLALVGLSWLPTANLLFPTGVVIAERTLYLASAGAALIAAALFDAAAHRWGARRAAVVVAVAGAAFAVRTVTQIPVWRDNRDLVLWAVQTHPQSAREHQVAARALVRLGQLPAALHQYELAVELYPLDPNVLIEAGNTALAIGRWRLAREYSRQVLRLAPADTLARRLSERADAAAAAAASPGLRSAPSQRRRRATGR